MTDAPRTSPDDYTPDPDPVASMLAVLDLVAVGSAHHRGHLHRRLAADAPRPGLRRSGARPVDRRRGADAPRRPIVHSMHGYFLRPGDASKGITFSVDRIHDGRSFSTRRTQAFQEGVPIFSMIASFQDEDPGLEHQAAMPAGRARHPKTFPISRIISRACTRSRSGSSPIGPLDLRHVPSPIYLSVRGRARPAPGRLDAHATRDSPTIRHCIARRWPTSAT